MTDIFEEVEEKLREDALLTWWKKYGYLAIGGIIAIVVGVGGHSAWTSWRTSVNRAEAEKFVALQKQAEADPSVEAALGTFAKSASGGYKALAQMERAAALAAKGENAQAVAAFDEAAKAASDPVLKQSAQLRAAYIAAETESFANLQARLEPLIAARGPFSYLARELIGVEAWKSGHVDRARTEFAYLEAAFDAPAGVRSRAQNFLALIGPEAPGKSAPAPAGAADPASSKSAPPKTGDKK